MKGLVICIISFSIVVSSLFPRVFVDSAGSLLKTGPKDSTSRAQNTGGAQGVGRLQWLPLARQDWEDEARHVSSSGFLKAAKGLPADHR